MTNQDFLLHLKGLRAHYDAQLLTGIEYNRRLLQLHADHAAAMLVDQPGPKVARPIDHPKPVLPLGLSYAHTEWARQHDWYIRRGLDNNGYFVVVRATPLSGGFALEHTFRDYNELRAWAGY